MDGLGQRAATGAGYQFPPLWGPDSFNSGAEMSRLLTAAAYAMDNMPIDTPYGPYADQFSPEQHKFGPFEPIRARVRELAAQSWTENAGEPDNGSAEPEKAR